MTLDVDERETDPAAPGYGKVGLTGAVLLACLLAAAFGYLADRVAKGDTLAFDQSVLAATMTDGHPLGPAWLQEAGRDVTALGSFSVLGLVTVATVGYLLLVRRRGQAWLMAVAVLGGVGLSSVLKLSFDRPRPDIHGAVRVFTSSFPSGHATVSTVTFLTLGAMLANFGTDRRSKIYVMGVACFLTIVVGLSRLYLGLHYVTDVASGWCVGGAWAILCWAAARHLPRRAYLRGAVTPP